MVIIYLLVTIATVSYAYPSIKVEPEKAPVEDSKAPSNLGNDIFDADTREKKLNSNCNKTIDYNEIIKTIQQINSLRDKTLEMLENSIVEKEETTKATTSNTESSTVIRTTFNDNAVQQTTNYDFSTETSTLELENQTTNFNSTTINDELDVNSTTLRQIREDKNLSETMFENQEDDDGGGLLGAILSGFLGSLSKPDGSVDVDAVISTIAMLSKPQPDGSYNFQGLTDTLGAFFGGDDDEDGGGSNVGAFAGGLTAALIKGVTRPGAKGVGTFIGYLLKEILPAASGPAEPDPDGENSQVDAGGFLGGLLHTLFGDDMNKGMSSFQTVKSNIVRFAFSAISSIVGTSSAGSSGHGNSNEKLVLKYPK